MRTIILFCIICDLVILALAQQNDSIVEFFGWNCLDISYKCKKFLEPNNYKLNQILLPLTKKCDQNINNLGGKQQNLEHNIIDKKYRGQFILAHVMGDERCYNVGVRVYVKDIVNNYFDNTDNMNAKAFLRRMYTDYIKFNNNKNMKMCEMYCFGNKITHSFAKEINCMNDMINSGLTSIKHLRHGPQNLERMYSSINNFNTNHGFGANSKSDLYEEVTDLEIVNHKNNNFVKGRNTIVHLFEWKWEDIAKECEQFLSHKKFAGVQISPPNENQVITISANRPWWERYQPVSYKLITRSGDKSSLRSMIRRCNAVGVRIYVDAVFNHMAAIGGKGTAGTNCNSRKKYYPGVPYIYDNFHDTCAVNNYNDAINVRNCELVHLRDLDQSQEYVRQAIVQYLNDLVRLGIAGFRVDAAKHMWPSDLKTIYRRVKDLSTEHGFPKGTRPYFYQEVIDLGGEAVSKREYTDYGAVLEFKFGAELGKAFQGNNPLKYLKNWGPEWGLLNGEDAVAFIDNHDNQREKSGVILTYKKPKRYKMAIAFMLAHPYGTTRIMSSFQFDSFDQGPPNYNGNIIGPDINENGSCTNGWVCEHRWRQVYNMVDFRNIVEGTNITNWWDNDANQIAFGRGDTGFIAFTLNGDLDKSLKTSLPPGTYCDIISGSLDNQICTGKSIQVNSNGYAAISLRENEMEGVVAFHVNSKL